MEEIVRKMRQIAREYPYLSGWAVLTRDGIVLASEMSAIADEVRLGAVAAAALSIAERWSQCTERTPVEYVLLGQRSLRTLFLPAGEEGCLTIFLGPEGDWRLIVATCCAVADELGKKMAIGEV